MIEVEKKFKLTPQQSKRLITDAVLVGEKQIVDVYFDNDAYTLTRADMWLRRRNGRFELKRPTGANNGETFVYDELEDDEAIREALHLPEGELDEKLLKQTGYSAFCKCKTVRTKYKTETFDLDMDMADFGDFSYELAEIEIMVEDKSEVTAAEKTIAEIARKYGLSGDKVRGKIIEYIACKRPDHFSVLKEAWNDPTL